MSYGPSDCRFLHQAVGYGKVHWISEVFDVLRKQTWVVGYAQLVDRQTGLPSSCTVMKTVPSIWLEQVDGDCLSYWTSFIVNSYGERPEHMARSKWAMVTSIWLGINGLYCKIVPFAQGSAQGYRFWCFSAQLYSTMFSVIESFHKRFADIRV